MARKQLGQSARQRFIARLWHYLAFTVFFALLYAGISLWLGSFPDRLLLAILIVSVLKDLYDEYQLQHGGQPLAYANIEHSPSNAVLIAFILSGVIDPSGTYLGIPTATWALALAVGDLLFDLSQDARA
ncbi:hypothetical protein Har1130_06725 [Haloarcula sp. CBA1130]|uniref:hypothetical protein n=1 Tax=unclassified Haloarcula TaxID=2624677 RepID=UPI001247ECA1|nr:MULTISPECIES: hypothetical protein [unclassified Haloarcula]KAA9397866.1 hypothetical protein Har1129_06415 [Haloarcula sp. CBA1129]KAA9402446.1 hypothetical protein Har1130_06725 [Haloarcula sp. CBA1130]